VEGDPAFRLNIAWPDELTTMAGSFSNVYAIQIQPDAIVLILGQSALAPMQGTPEEIRELLTAQGSVPGIPVGKFIIPFARAAELRDGLTQALAAIAENQNASSAGTAETASGSDHDA
jgi:hypothetical protein